LRISTVDAHTGGEPLRIVLRGLPDLPSVAVPEVRRYVRENHDFLRRLLMWEPRGHADMYGCLVTPPASEENHLGVVFLHNEGYSTMCGHGIIAVVKVLIDTGVVECPSHEDELRIETPAGLVTARAYASDGSVRAVSFQNVPSFVVDLDATIHVDDLGDVHYDLAFGGAFYAFVRAADVGLQCRPQDYRSLIDVGMAIKDSIARHRMLTHPVDPDLGFLYGTIFTGPSDTTGVHSRNVCVFANRQVDRSPTGTGVSARAAIHHARGQLDIGEWMEIESIIGSRFRVRSVERVTVGSYHAVIPEVEGTAFITGRHEFILDPADPLGAGFLLR
jgi:trans-L-3-hydroxyproline dehydratase